jgi:hypothetical protein
MNMGDIWGAGDKPKYKKPESVKDDGMERAWTRNYVDEVINRGLNGKFKDFDNERVMDILNCSVFVLMNLQSVTYEAFTLDRARELAVKTNQYGL